MQKDKPPSDGLMWSSEESDLLNNIHTSSVARHIILIDPDSQTSEEAAKRCVAAVIAGSRMIFVGGSTGTDSNNVHETVKAIQETLELCSWNASQDSSSDSEMWEIPVVLFPAAANAFSSAADGITFMMLMNSTTPKFLIEEQLKGAMPIKQANVTPISMGYVVCAPGGKVGEVGQANLITENDIDLITSYAICAESYGFSTIYLEAGSGANQAVSPELIRAVRNSCNLTLLVGGGIRDGKSASIAVDAGADWIVTGNLTEGFSNSHELQLTLQTFISEMNS